MVRRSAGKQEGRRFDSRLRLAFLFKNCDLWTLYRDFAPAQFNETLKWLTSLAHLNAEIIVVVTVQLVRYKLPLSPRNSTVGTASGCEPDIKLD